VPPVSRHGSRQGCAPFCREARASKGARASAKAAGTAARGLVVQETDVNAAGHLRRRVAQVPGDDQERGRLG
jgi:hypothetical protein